MSPQNSTMDDCRERLDTIKTLAGMISDGHAVYDQVDLSPKETCKLALLIQEAAEQADTILSAVQGGAA